MGYLNRKCRSVNMRLQLCRAMAIAALFFGAMCGGSASAASEPDGYPVLVNLFQQWREFEHPVMKNNVPDYSTSAMAARAAALPRWRKRLDAIDPKSWPIEEQNDYKLVKAEMNGLDFNLRVLRPWSRDPAFYVSIWDSRSDVPARDPDALIKGYAGVVSVMANVLPGGMGYNFFICTPGIYDREPPRTFEGGSGLWGFLKSSKSYVVKDPTFGEVGFGCKVEATDRALTVYPKDGLQKRVRFVEAAIDVEVMQGQIKRASLSRGKPKLSLEVSDPSGLAKKSTISFDGLPAGNYKLSYGKSARRVTVKGTLSIDLPMRDAHQIEIEQV